MADRDVTLFFHEKRLAALEDELRSQGTTVTEALEKEFQRLYEELVPENDRAKIEADILQELEQEATAREASRRFALIHLHDEEDDFAFTSELYNRLPGIARIYRERMQPEVGKVTLDSLPRHFLDANLLDELSASKLSNALGHDQRLTAAVDFDFERGCVAVSTVSDPATKVYSLEDFSTAAYKAFRKSGLSPEARQELFDLALEGKEIELTTGPVLGM